MPTRPPSPRPHTSSFAPASSRTRATDEPARLLSAEQMAKADRVLAKTEGIVAGPEIMLLVLDGKRAEYSHRQVIDFLAALWPQKRRGSIVEVGTFSPGLDFSASPRVTAEGKIDLHFEMHSARGELKREEHTAIAPEGDQYAVWTYARQRVAGASSHLKSRVSITPGDTAVFSVRESPIGPKGQVSALRTDLVPTQPPTILLVEASVL